MRRSAPFLAAWLLMAGSLPAHAIPRPEIATEIGRTFMIDGPLEGVFDQGGFATTLSALWPVDDRFRFGVSLFADEAGSWRDDFASVLQGDGGFLGEPVRLTPEELASLAALGSFDFGHVNIYGAAWRLEAAGPRVGRFNTFARGGFGLYQIHVDLIGTYIDSEAAVGWSAGGGALLPLGAHNAVGLTVAFDRVFHDYFRHYMSAGLSWRWHPSLKPHAAPPPRR